MQLSFFYIQWITRKLCTSQRDILIFNLQFTKGLDESLPMKRAFKKWDIFEPFLIVIPIHIPGHYIFCVLVNAGKVADPLKKQTINSCIPFILFLDSLGGTYNELYGFSTIKWLMFDGTKNTRDRNLHWTKTCSLVFIYFPDLQFYTFLFHQVHIGAHRC